MSFLVRHDSASKEVKREDVISAEALKAEQLQVEEGFIRISIAIKRAIITTSHGRALLVSVVKLAPTACAIAAALLLGFRPSRGTVLGSIIH
jgi:hypothetical protein